MASVSSTLGVSGVSGESVEAVTPLPGVGVVWAAGSPGSGSGLSLSLSLSESGRTKGVAGLGASVRVGGVAGVSSRL